MRLGYFLLQPLRCSWIPLVVECSLLLPMLAGMFVGKLSFCGNRTFGYLKNGMSLRYSLLPMDADNGIVPNPKNMAAAKATMRLLFAFYLFYDTAYTPMLIGLFTVSVS